MSTTRYEKKTTWIELRQKARAAGVNDKDENSAENDNNENIIRAQSPRRIYDNFL